MKNKIISYTVTIGLFFVIIPGALIGLGWFTDAIFSLPRLALWNFHQLAGVLVAACGLGLIAWCWYLLCTVGEGHPQEILNNELTPPPCRLVSCGPYRYVRNPMCWGFTFYIAGIGLLLGLYGGALLSPVLYLGGGSIYFVLVEEKKLLFRFRQTYQVYRAQTPMLVPNFFASSRITSTL